MSKSAVLLLVLVFLIALCLTGTMPSSVAFAAENTWATKAPIPQAESHLRAATVNGKIYVIGPSINYEYDPATDTWAEKTPMPTQRINFAIAAHQSKIYTIGAWGSSGFSCENEVYDPLTDTWEIKEAVPTGGTSAQASVVGDKIHVITLENHYCYDIAHDSWTTKEPKPLRYDWPKEGTFRSAVVDGKIYTFSWDRTQIYDPKSDSWSLGASSPNIVNGPGVCATTGVMAYKRIYVIGGAGGFEGVDLTQVYDPAKDSWTLGASMPTARLGLTVAVVNDQIYAIAGSSYAPYSPVLTISEQYNPLGYGTPDPSYDDISPEIAVLSPENTTYYSANVTLGFVVNEQTSWMGYSLDGSNEVTIAGNTTLTSLSVGTHNVTVYAWDDVGNAEASETITFTIAEPFPIVPIAAASVAAVISVVLLVYFTKRKQQMTSHES